MIRFGKTRSRLKGIWLLVSMVFLVTSIPNLNMVLGAPIETATAITSSTGAIMSGEALNFSIFVYSGYDPVSTGSIRVTDTNTSQYINGMILGGVVIIEWIPDSPFIEGVHIFKAEFLGYLDYSSSFDECVVYFDDYGSDSTRETAISLGANSTAVFKNKTIEFTVELIVLSQWYLNGGFIFIKNTNLNGSPVIHTHGPLPSYFPGTNPLRYSFSFDYQIPVFSPVGVNSFVAEYTGSSQSHTQPCVSSSVDISIISAGFYLEQNLDQVVLQRENSVLEISTTILGDYPVGLNLTHSYNISDEKIIFDNQILANRNVTTTFSPDSSVPTGPLSLLTELIDPSTSIVYTNSTNIVSIFDNARIDYTTNTTEYKHNETIRFDVYVTEEDIWTNPISYCDVELIDITDNHSIEIKTTVQTGFVSFEYRIPDNATVGEHDFCLSTLNAGLYINDISVIFSIPIKGLIDIEITYQSGGVDRNTYTPIEITVLSGGIVVNEGLVALEFSTNGTAIETKNCEAGLVFNYYISPSHPLGAMSYKIHFYNSDNYDEQTEIFDLTIFSNPELISIGQNSTEVIKGQTLRIWGYLLDENDDPVTFEAVNLKDTTTGLSLGTTETDDQGIFYFDYQITESLQIGVHFIEIDYQGNFLKFYRESINTPLIGVTIRPPLSVFISTEVIANSWTILSLEGGLFDEIFLSWQELGDSEWISIGSAMMNSTGQGEFNWTTPYYKGQFSVRAIGPNSTKYDYSTMCAIPLVNISSSGIGNVNDPYAFIINSTERFQIWVGGQIWQTWQAAGIHSYEYIFTSRGIKELKVITNDSYVYYNEYYNEITIFEEVIVSLYSPIEAFVNLTVNIDGAVLGEVSGPLGGLDTILVINGSDVEVDSTNGAGYYDFSILFESPGYYSLLVRIPQNEFYTESSSDLTVIFIHSIPAEVEITSPLNKTYGSIIEVELSGNADSYLYRIDPIDSTNISWTSTTYRTLDEGNYTCYVYGMSAYGIITSRLSNFIVDTTAPSLALLTPNNGTYTSNEITLSYLTDASDIRAFLDGVELDNPESGIIISDLEEGDHNISLTAKDKVGNDIGVRAFFSVDTIPPSLNILSPFNQSYIGNIMIDLDSNGTTILYHIIGIHPYNQSYSSPLTLNLSIGNYILNTYAYDDAGNFKVKSVEFSLVQRINLLLNPSLDTIDGAGNYLVKTQVISHPNFESAGIILNGTFSGNLGWSSLHSDYRLNFQLNSPGKMQLTLFAKTVNDEYDFYYYNISWVPPSPIFEDINAIWVSSYYEVLVKLDTESLDLNVVNVTVDNIDYELSYEFFGDRWVINLPISPRNECLLFSAFYPWDEIPSSQKEYAIHWIAPSIITNSYKTTRENFTIEVTVEKQNASINSNSINLILDNGSVQINVNGILVYESLSGSYQEWVFSSPNLPRNVWNFTLSAKDIYGINRSIHGIFNATDSPPTFTGSLVKEKATHDDRVLYRVEIAVDDDYMVDRVFLYIDGIPVQSSSQNNTHFIFEVYMIEGVHTLRVVAFDDINQENTLILESIEVIITENNSTTSTTEENQTNISSSETISGNSLPSTGGNDIIELGLAGGILGILVALGNVITRIKKT